MCLSINCTSYFPKSASLFRAIRKGFLQLTRELLHNVRQFVHVTRKFNLSKSFQLMLVKLIDYSDHLPVSLLPTTREHDCKEIWLAEVKSSLNRTLDKELIVDSAFSLDDYIIETSYCAGRGSSDSHPHVIHAHIEMRGEDKVLVCRYFDDESTVWLTNMWRASTVTIAEIVIGLRTKKVLSVRYFRYRSPKREKFFRNTVFRNLHIQLNNSSSIPPLLMGHVTFGCIFTSAENHLLCRFASLAIYPQLSIAQAILREVIELVGIGLIDEKKQAEGCGAIRRTRGRKELRTTRVKRETFLCIRKEN